MNNYADSCFYKRDLETWVDIKSRGYVTLRFVQFYVFLYLKIAARLRFLEDIFVT